MFVHPYNCSLSRKFHAHLLLVYANVRSKNVTFTKALARVHSRQKLPILDLRMERLLPIGKPPLVTFFKYRSLDN